MYGPGKLLLAAGMAYVVRVIGYTLVPEGKMYLVLMLETLHGLTYAGSKAGGVEFIQQIIPEGYEASGQGILIFVTYFGVVAGLICAGWMQETLGARVMYRAMAAIVCVGISVLFLAELTHDKQEHQENSESNENSLLIKSSSSASAASDFADASTERYMKKLKYDSLNKYAS
jgi:MFS family permease